MPSLRMAEKIARELNRLTRGECDFLSADSSALLELIDEYLGPEEQEQDELPGSFEEAVNAAEGINKLTITIVVARCFR